MTREIKARDATKYPALFQNYWGSFTYGIKNAEITSVIIANRNQFVEEFGIIKTATHKALNPFFSAGYTVDHPEAYQTRRGEIVIVCSNYGGLPPARFKMMEYWPLYSHSVRTYIRVFNSTADMRAVMKGHTP